MGKTLDDILNEADEFGLLKEPARPAVRTDDDRLVASFEELNVFMDKNGREPASGNMAEYSLFSRLRAIRQDASKSEALSAYDRHGLLTTHTFSNPANLEAILEDDDLGLLEPAGDSSVYEFRHTPKPEKRAETDFVARRKALPEAAFERYEALFKQVHKDLKTGKRRMLPFDRFEDNLKEGYFYLMDGMLLYLEAAESESKLHKLKSGNRYRIDGRTRTIFENGTMSNMLFRSLGKAIQNGKGKLITAPDYEPEKVSAPEPPQVSEEDVLNGNIYVLRSLSTHPAIAGQPHLYKIGFSKGPVEERIKNAAREAAYLFADVALVQSCKCYNMSTQKFEHLVHRFFGAGCLNIDLFDKAQNRYSPREWFVVPLPVIEQAIDLVNAGSLHLYCYDTKRQVIVKKEVVSGNDIRTKEESDTSKSYSMSTEKKSGSGPRELIEPNGDKRYVRRDDEGKFTESDDTGRSLSHDVKKHSDTDVKPGYGDKGDRQKQ